MKGLVNYGTLRHYQINPWKISLRNCPPNLSWEEITILRQHLKKSQFLTLLTGSSFGAFDFIFYKSLLHRFMHYVITDILIPLVDSTCQNEGNLLYLIMGERCFLEIEL